MDFLNSICLLCQWYLGFRNPILAFSKIRKGSVCLPCWFWCCQTHSDLWAPRANPDPAVHRGSEALAQSLLTLSSQCSHIPALGTPQSTQPPSSPGHCCHCWAGPVCLAWGCPCQAWDRGAEPWEHPGMQEGILMAAVTWSLLQSTESGPRAAVTFQ